MYECSLSYDTYGSGYVCTSFAVVIYMNILAVYEEYACM